MSTRCNIAIKQKNKRTVIMYHHSDGYPEGVGKDLTEILETIRENKSKYNTPTKLAKYINEYDESFERDGYGLHGDIEYLYIINLDSESIVCYDAWSYYKGEVTDEDALNGKLPWEFTGCMWDSYDMLSFREKEE